HLRRRWALPLTLLPELLFLLCLFGYLVVLIVYKWVAYTAADSWHAPSILIHFIDMFLFTSSPSNLPLYTGQDKVQDVLVALAILCIPVLLLGKPVYLYVTSKRRQRQRARLDRYTSLTEETEALINVAEADIENADDDSDETVNMGDVFIKQGIHTIEYCLSCISNTASYLRLWALSLAHAQLSEVLWSMVLRQAFRMPGYAFSVAVFAAFAFFAVLTVAILLVMEGLSAFLHALRLHWVEFQSKFYSGSGVLFVPFSFSLLDLESLGP
ncbi:V-type proton ATPase 116 kDa subunit a 4-like, partial [Mobula hypostoma]|uniref:V-type proton ATPase 116 kDa subunit a 4-like n=1 Tax=Mobula hypostoma TaxID=723540 RepID=UPI002FC3CFCE